MKYQLLRGHLIRKSPPKKFVLKNCKVVIDGTIFFKNTYVNSGSSSILGGEYDRYANHMKTILKPYMESNVTCYVIFRGGKVADIDGRVEIHQRVINRAACITPYEELYCDPIFINDVPQQVLEELGIKYYVTDTSPHGLVKVAQQFNCPLVTQNFEYAVKHDCILAKSMKFDDVTKSINCQIFYTETVNRTLRIENSLLPLFLTLVDENSSIFIRLPDIIGRSNNLVTAALEWICLQRSGLENTIRNIVQPLSENESNEFMNDYNNWHDFLKPKPLNPGQLEGIVHGRSAFAKPYLNLYSRGTLSGSWVIFDKNEEDAMLASLDIICFAYSVLKKSTDINITFIGRKGETSCSWKIEKDFSSIMPINEEKESFRIFLDINIPGFDLDSLQQMPKDCWMLLVTLVYFCRRRMDFELACSFIMSYVMLGPVSARVGVIEKCNFMSSNVVENDQCDENGLKLQDCDTAVRNLIDLFYVKDLKNRFDRGLLHKMAEFQHSLQHMNYLNVLVSEPPLIKPTIYHKTINATFVYNLYLELQGVDDMTEYLKKRLNNSTVFQLYKNIQHVFKVCLGSVGLLTKNSGEM